MKKKTFFFNLRSDGQYRVRCWCSMVAVMLQWEWKAGWQQLVEHIRDCCGSVKSVLLLDVVHVMASLKLNRLNSLGRLCNWSLNRGSVHDDGLQRACTSHHLGSDHLKLLRIQLYRNLVDLPSGRGDLLENLESSWRSCCCAWLLHLMVWLSLLLLLLLLRLELNHLGLLLAHCDCLHTS